APRSERGAGCRFSWPSHRITGLASQGPLLRSGTEKDHLVITIAVEALDLHFFGDVAPRHISRPARAVEVVRLEGKRLSHERHLGFPPASATRDEDFYVTDSSDDDADVPCATAHR